MRTYDTVRTFQGAYSGIPLNSVWEKIEGGKRDETVFSAL